eukprot:195863-Rhodomonas_salina.1
MSRQASSVNLGTIGSVAPVPVTGEGGDEIAPRYQVGSRGGVVVVVVVLGCRAPWRCWWC